jgi:transcriptional regulator with XRE-family HTH domain
MTSTPTTRRAFGLRMRLLRETLGLTEADMAAIIGRKLCTYRRIEEGTSRVPFRGLESLGSRYRIDWEWLIAGTAPAEWGQSPAAAIRKTAGIVAH